MVVTIRPLRVEDINQVAKIEQQAFPTIWPPSPLKRDLENRRIKYLVALQPSTAVQEPPFEAGLQKVERPPTSANIVRLMGAVKERLVPRRVQPESNDQILGYVGLWLVAEDAHITAIAVEESFRGKGIGELLLIGSIELAKSRDFMVVSLEARVSNYVAQSLYTKYGFEKAGMRRAYYTDNREDAVIMTTNPISAPDYQARFIQLVGAYEKRYGNISMVLP